MKYAFDSYEDFSKEYNTYHFDECCICGGICELVDSDVMCCIEEITLHFSSIHLLRCKKCGVEFLPQYSKQIIEEAYKTTVKERQSHGKFNPTGYRKKFEYCTDLNYIYDHRDYYNIPGLCYDEEHSVEGFLTPVYFEKMHLYIFLLYQNMR